MKISFSVINAPRYPNHARGYCNMKKLKWGIGLYIRAIFLFSEKILLAPSFPASRVGDRRSKICFPFWSARNAKGKVSENRTVFRAGLEL